MLKVVHKPILNFRLQRFATNLQSFTNVTFDTSLLIFVTDIHFVVNYSLIKV